MAKQHMLKREQRKAWRGLTTARVEPKRRAKTPRIRGWAWDKMIMDDMKVERN